MTIPGLVFEKRRAQGTVLVALLIMGIMLVFVFVSFMSDFQKARTVYQYYVDTRSANSMEGLRTLYVPASVDYSLLAYSGPAGDSGGVDPSLAASHGAIVLSSYTLSRNGGTPSSPPPEVVYWGNYTPGLLHKHPPFVYDPTQFPVRLKPGDSITLGVPRKYPIPAKSVLVTLVFINETHTAEIETSVDRVTAEESWSYALGMNGQGDTVTISVPASQWSKPVVIVERVYYSPYPKDLLSEFERPLQEKLEEYRREYSSGYSDVTVDAGEPGSWRAIPSPTQEPLVVRMTFLKKGVVFSGGARTNLVSSNSTREAYETHEIKTPYYYLYQKGMDLLYNWEGTVRSRIIEKVRELRDNVNGKSDSWGCSYPAPYSSTTLFQKREGLDWGSDDSRIKSALTQKILDGLELAEGDASTSDVRVELYLVGDIRESPDISGFWANTYYDVWHSTGACCECVACGCGTTCGSHCRVYHYTSEYEYGAEYVVLARLLYTGNDPEVVGDDTDVWFVVEDGFVESNIEHTSFVNEDHCPEVTCGNCPPCPPPPPS